MLNNPRQIRRGLLFLHRNEHAAMPVPDVMTLSQQWLIELPSCDSTNAWALSHLQALRHGACIYTTKQTAGRGRDGKTWQSPPGVLTASFVLSLHDQVPVTHLALAAGLALAHVVDDLGASASVQIKWPNDCYMNGLKLAGILCERPASTCGHVVVGIGCNISVNLSELMQCTPTPTRLADYVDKLPTDFDILQGIRRYLLEATGLLAAGGWKHVLEQMQNRDYLFGKSLTVQAGSTTTAGIGAGIDEQGRLLVKAEQGNVQALFSGHVQLRDTASH